MSEVQPVGSPQVGSPHVRAAIARAAEKTGVDFDYLLAQARLESSLDPSARAGTSSAAGLYQFTRGTWLETLDRHGAEHGLGWADAAIEGGRMRDPAMRAQVMALRYDPDASALMAAELAQDNRAALTGVLGREPDAPELYLAHFLGQGGASQFLTAMEANPGQSAAALMPAPAAANRGIFYERGGAPRSLGGVMEVIRGKVAGAMEGSSLPPASPEGFEGWVPPAWSSRGGTAAAGEAPAALAPPPRPSMAETLKTTFALNTGSQSIPAHVRTAYGQLRAFGL